MAHKINRKIITKATTTAALNCDAALFIHTLDIAERHVVRAVNAHTGHVYHVWEANDPRLIEKAARFALSMQEARENGRTTRYAGTDNGACISFSDHVASVLRTIGVRC